MNSEKKEGENREISIEPDDLKPKRPSNRAPEGIRTFTVPAARRNRSLW